MNEKPETVKSFLQKRHERMQTSPTDTTFFGDAIEYMTALETANAELKRKGDKLAEQIEHITKQFPKEPMPDENGEYPIVFIGKSAPVWKSMREAVAALREWEQRKGGAL